ncbi:MAG: ATP-dependent DNA helicase RecQ [Kiritimatiellae bacterium]|nr:ATP-dependent DNA helicase RecQ [Kiritimatiellia bacterium]
MSVFGRDDARPSQTVTDDEIRASLAKWFHHDAFRTGQQEAVRECVEGRDVVVIMPTGSGKSICYQLAAMLLPGTTLVVSPLIALMKDQTDALDALDIPSTFINSSVSAGEMSLRLSGLAAGRYKLVYVAPERFRNERFQEALAHASVSLLAVDEAHCISQWGHDFRPDYLNLRNVASHLPGVRIMAVTATATPDVRRDIVKQLGLGEPPRQPPIVHVHGFARENLSITVSRCATHDEKTAHVMKAVRDHGCGIVYAATRKQAERVYERVVRDLAFTGGVAAGGVKPDVILYHGALADNARKEAQELFTSSPCPVVIATNAFGMGVDRPDIRFVVHWDVPGSIEAYYQEIGRAGRDGKPAFCDLLFNYADVRTQEFFIENNFAHGRDEARPSPFGRDEARPSPFGRDEARHSPFGRDEARPSQGEDFADEVNPREVEAARRLKRAKLDAMLQFVDCRGCRHKYILEYFGEDATHAKCGGCDHCSGAGARPLTEAQWIVVQKILSCVARMKGRFGPRRIIQVLTGDDDPILEEKGLTALSTYGILQDTNPRLLSQLLDRLADTGCIAVTDDAYHMMSITEKGVAVAHRRFHGFTLAWPSTGGRPAPRQGRFWRTLG